MQDEVLIFLLFWVGVGGIFLLIQKAISRRFGDYVANDLFTRVVALWVALFAVISIIELLTRVSGYLSGRL